jgi:hypothetical protein
MCVIVRFGVDLCAHLHMSVCVHLHAHVLSRARACVRLSVFVREFVSLYIHARVCVYASIYVPLCVYVHLCMILYVYACVCALFVVINLLAIQAFQSLFTRCNSLCSKHTTVSSWTAIVWPPP